jgi:hypothetical protein
MTCARPEREEEKADDGRWTMDDGKATMDDRRWTMENGKPTMDDGR